MQRTQPVKSSFSAPWFEACNDGRLLLQRCGKCSQFQFYPRILCAHCGADTPAWAEASGDATLASFTVVRRAVSKAYTIPYVVALVQLAEGPQLMSHIVDVESDALRIGMPLTLRFEAWSEDSSMPVFTPVDKQEV